MGEPREWWIVDLWNGPQATRSCVDRDPELSPEWAKCADVFHVVEKSYADRLASELAEARAEVERLKAENWVLRDNSLRTYDGLTTRHDRYALALTAIAHKAESFAAPEEREMLIQYCLDTATEALAGK